MGDFNGSEFKSNIRYNDTEIGVCAAERRTISFYNEEKSLLCVPIIRLYNTIGVIALQKNNAAFSENTSEIIETLTGK